MDEKIKGLSTLLGLKTLRLGFRLVAKEDAKLPGFLGSMLRGSLAWAVARISKCAPALSHPAAPLLEGLFDGKLPGLNVRNGKSQEIPHPIVVVPPSEAVTKEPISGRLDFEVVLIGPAIDTAPFIVFAVSEMASVGLGVRRSRFEFAELLNRSGESIPIGDWVREVRTVSDLVTQSPGVNQGFLRLKTPLRLQAGGQIEKDGFDFPLFVKTACRRLWTLATLYGPSGSEDLDFRPLLQSELAIRVIEDETNWLNLSRFSERQGRKVEISGRVGRVRLEGDFRALWPVLVAAQEFHVGKGTVMGLGAVEFIPAIPT